MIKTSNQEIKRQFSSILITREGGSVNRCHTLPHHGQYPVSSHSYGAVSILLILHPQPRIELIKYMLWHDVTERWLGDIPAFSKWLNPHLEKEYQVAESQANRILEILPDLTEEEMGWIEGCDRLEMWFWCQEQLFLGNKYVLEPLDVLKNRILELPQIPEVFKEIVKLDTWRRLPNVL